jgi:hypothetical protein
MQSSPKRAQKWQKAAENALFSRADKECLTFIPTIVKHWRSPVANAA